jgi:hypothetical protein
VNRARDRFPSGAALTDDQHRAAALRHLADDRDHVPHRRGRTEQRLLVGATTPRAAGLQVRERRHGLRGPREGRHLERIRHRRHHVVHQHGPSDDVGDPQAESLGGGISVPAVGDADHRRPGALRGQLSDEAESVGGCEVDEDDLDAAVGQLRRGLRHRLDDNDLAAGDRQRAEDLRAVSELRRDEKDRHFTWAVFV